MRYEETLGKPGVFFCTLLHTTYAGFYETSSGAQTFSKLNGERKIF